MDGRYRIGIKLCNKAGTIETNILTNLRYFHKVVHVGSVLVFLVMMMMMISVRVALGGGGEYRGRIDVKMVFDVSNKYFFSFDFFQSAIFGAGQSDILWARA